MASSKIVGLLVWWLCSAVVVAEWFHFTSNMTIAPVQRPLLDHKIHHPNQYLWTTTAGAPVDLRDTRGMNNDPLRNIPAVELRLHQNNEKIPNRLAFSKGAGALGYFEVTHDVSKYTKADVFNGIGKKTPIVGRFSPGLAGDNFPDVKRDIKSMSIKLYTKDGNLDLLGVNYPIFSIRDAIEAQRLIRIFEPNPTTNMIDTSAIFDYTTLQPYILHVVCWILSDYGIPANYRQMDAFPLYTYRIVNEIGEQFYVKFNLRTEQGLANLTTPEAMAIQAFNLDSYTTDLYNAIGQKNYPSWRLEMDVMTEHDIRTVNYNPFDTNELWRKGTYHTVKVGRFVFDKNPINHFAQVEQLAFNPTNLVPGIPGPVDHISKVNAYSYKAAQDYRLHVNYNKIEVNAPKYAETYTRDGFPPVRDNMKDTPDYYPNSFKGPLPTVDTARPKYAIELLSSYAVDLAPVAYFYNKIMSTDAQKNRLVANLVFYLLVTLEPVADRFLDLLGLVDADFERRTRIGLAAARVAAAATPPAMVYSTLGQIIGNLINIPALANLTSLPKHDTTH